MDSDEYGGGDMPAMPDKMETAKAGDDQDDMARESTLVPSSMFGGEKPQPGQTCTFKVVHCYEKECELQYVGSDKGEGESEGDMHPMEKRMMPFANQREE